MALIITPGASSADSYVTVAAAGTFFGKLRLSSAWDGLADTAAKEKVLKNATMEIDRYLREQDFNTTITFQALAWPWWGSDRDGDFTRIISADSGSTTTLVASILANSHWPDDFWNDGSLWIKDAGDAAPEFELRAITDFVRSTGTVTTAAFTTAIESGDNAYLIRPVPQWLQDATCYQADHLLIDKRTETGADRQAGVSSRSDPQGGSVSYRNDPVADWLSRAAYKLLLPNIQYDVDVGRGS